MEGSGTKPEQMERASSRTGAPEAASSPLQNWLRIENVFAGVGNVADTCWLPLARILGPRCCKGRMGGKFLPDSDDSVTV